MQHRAPCSVNVLIASPDFGVGGAVVLFLCGIGFVVIGISVIALAGGMILWRRPPPHRQWPGFLLVAVGILLPVSCCIGPSVLFRLNYDTPPLGRYPNGVVERGMSPDEVRKLLGNPHQVNDEDPARVRWLYWLDAMELGWFTVSFGNDGKVDSTGGN